MPRYIYESSQIYTKKQYCWGLSATLNNKFIHQKKYRDYFGEKWQWNPFTIVRIPPCKNIYATESAQKAAQI